MSLSRFFRTVSDGLTKMLGWSPTGRRVKITMSESLDGSLFGQVISGKITEIAHTNTPDSHDTIQEYAIVDLDFNVNYMNHHLTKIAVLPRHIDYGLSRLPFTGIGVYVIPADDLDETNEASVTNAVAIWWLSL
ncbi:MAG: hypothetical protein U1E83_09210 [Methylotetracoccus sp.]